MKKEFFFCLLLIYGFTPVKAQQKDIPIEPLTQQFYQLYFNNKSESDFLFRMMAVAEKFLQTDNDLFTKTVSKIIVSEKISPDSASNLVFKIVLDSFIKREYIWNDYPGILEKARNLFVFYNSKLCPCLKQYADKNTSGILGADDLDSCVYKLLSDTSYTKQVLRIFQNETVGDLAKIIQPEIMYLYLNCQPMRDWFNSHIMVIPLILYVRHFKDYRTNLDNNLLLEYKKKQSPGLVEIFPEYKKYEKDISQLNDIKKTDLFWTMEELPETTGRFSFMKTYFHRRADKSPILDGQVIFRLRDASFQSPLEELHFIPPDKINNPAKLLNNLIGDNETIHPPPIPGLQMAPADSIPPGLKRHH
ncbi:MAG: hypothetical protein IPP73_10385 [Chitinophagaceae bacterium]|nr:hypothetical protein [Chitinophagaceae bacterium]